MNQVSCWISKVFAASSFLLLVLGLPASAQSAPSPEVIKGQAWLQAQLQTSGALTNEAASIATPFQNRAEALQTLKLLATVPNALADQLAADTEDNTEYLARRAVTLSLAGRDASTITALLMARQNLDGGFGGAAGYGSNAQDTALVMMAMAQNAMSATPAGQSARGSLLAAIQADGGVGSGSDSARIHANALALLALQMFPSDLNTANALKQISTWLLLKQKADGSWLGDSYLTALSLAAVSPVVSDPAIRASARTYLTGLQQTDGSWGGDPFLTAVALRALAFEPATAPSATSSLIGQVLDQNTATPIGGATVTLSGASTATATTAMDGKISIQNLAAGSYALQVTRTGYASYTNNYQVIAGQSLNVGSIVLGQLQTSGIVRGKVSAAATGQALAGVTVQLNGAATTLTDANGLYEFVSVPPGAVALSASAAGYVTSSGSGTLLAGQTLIFSPALYATGASAPTTGRFTGKVVAAGSTTPLAGVSILMNATAAGVTAADGSFDLTLPPASYSTTFTLAGYDSATTGFLLTAGAIVNAGTIELSPQLASTTISGIVKDVASGKPITGAQVQVLNGAVATTGADGAFSLTGLMGTSFDLRVSAVGYVTQQAQLQTSRPSAIAQDFSLQVQTGAGLSLEPLLVSPASVASRAEVSVGATVNNAASGTPVSGVLTMQVVDGQGKVVSNAIAYDKTGTNLVGVFTLDPGQQLPVMFRWNSGQFPAGNYSLIARVVEAGSMSTATPLGRVLSEAQGSLAITSDQHFGGTITADPPVLQINTNTSVHLSAVLANDGNADLPAQSYQLQIIDEKTGTAVATQQANGTSFPPNNLQNLTFADWTPAAGGGNYRIELQATTSAALGKVTGKVYVGDAATAAFTVNKLVVPAGTQSVKGTIKVTGQDATQGTISDPLAPLIKTAIQKAVTYNDAQASSWYTNNRCLGCHVVTQALVGGELNRDITTFNATQRQTLLDALVTSQKHDGTLDNSHPMFARTQTVLGLWALNSWHNKSEIVAPSLRAANYLLGQQNANGSWTPDYTDAGWWITQVAHTGLTTKSLVEVDELIKQTPTIPFILDLSFRTQASCSSIGGSNKGGAGDAAGNIYLTSYSGGTLTLIKPDGTKQTLLSGLRGPRPPAFGSDGALYIPGDGGVIKYTLDGQKTTVSTMGATGVALGPDGNMYAVNYWNHKISKITPAGVVSDYVVNDLYYPHGLAFDAAGALLVADSGNSRILKYAAGKTTLPLVVVASTSGTPYSLLQVGNEWIVGTYYGLYRYNSTWQGKALIKNGQSWSLSRMPNGKVLLGDSSANFFVAPGTPILLSTLGTAITKSTDWLLVDTNITTSNNLDLAHRLIGLGSALRYFAGTAKATTIQAKMEQTAATLRSRQRTDGGWTWKTNYSTSDSMVTAQVGVALDYLQPSPKDPVVQNAINLLLGRQQPDGSWRSENGILGTRLAATTWVAIWLPIALDRIAGIDTDLTVSMPANVSLSNPTVAPTSSVANAIGGKDYVWKLQGVTAAGRDLNFDLSLANMTLGENRPVAAESYLTFNNSFTQAQVKAPVSVPRVTASAFLNLGVTTDKTSYGADAPVAITAAVNNTSSGPLDGSVKLEIFDAANFRTAVVGTQPFTGLAAGAQMSLNSAWGTGSTAAGGYYVLATLYDAQNREVGTAKSVFNIVPGGAGGVPGVSGLAATVSVDKISYLPFDALRISGRVTNLLQNQAQSDLQAVVTMFKPDGTAFWTQTTPLQQLAVGGFVDLGYGSQLSAAVAGKYRVTLSVQNSLTGLEVAAAQTTFDVQSSANTGSGLKGRISALPKPVPQTDPVILDGAINNIGNADITALPVTVRIVEPLSQQVMAQWPYTANVVVGQAFQTALTWDTSTATVGATYVAVLTATVGGKEITLAQDNFTVTEPPVKLDVTQSAARENRVLAWIACAPEEHHDEHKDDKGHDARAAHDDHDDADHPKPVPPCLQKRSAFLHGLLTSYNVPHLITANAADFREAFRDGRYNVYWISGAVKPEHDGEEGKDDILKEVREAVYRGDSLIVDGEQGEHSEALQQAAGFEYRGKLPAKDGIVITSGLMFDAAQIQALGKANKLRTTTGAVQATFDGRDGDDHHDGDNGHDKDGGHDAHDGHDDHHSQQAQPAILSSAYGRGQALSFGFDLVDNLQNGSGMAAWNGILLTGLNHLLPPLPDQYTAGAYVSLSTRIQELAQRTTELAVTAHLPSGSTLLSTAPVATPDVNGNPVWQFTLPASTSKSLQLAMRLPMVSGSHMLPVTVDSIRNGQSKRYGEYSYNWTVSGSDPLLNQIKADLQQLVLSAAEERQARDKAVAKLQQAATFIGQKRYAEAMDALLDAVERLQKIRSTDISAYRLGIDRLLQETGWNWLRNPDLRAPEQHGSRKH